MVLGRLRPLGCAQWLLPALALASIGCGPQTRDAPARTPHVTRASKDYVAMPLDELEKKRLAGIRHPQLSDGVMEDFLETGQKRPHMELALCLDPGGAASEIKVLKSSTHGMADQIMVGAIRKWRFSPTLVDGRPVSVCTIVPFHWEIVVERPPQN